MSGIIQQLSISNYRSCRSLTIQLSELTPLVGFNNAGKSNIISALKWVLRPTVLSVHDFFDPNQEVFIEALISNVSSDLLATLGPRHQSRIQPYCANEVLAIRRCQPAPGGSKSNLVLEVGDGSSKTIEWTKNPTGIDQAIQALFPEPIEIGAMEDAAEDAAKNKAGTTISQLLSEILPLLGPDEDSRVAQALEGLANRYGSTGLDRPEAIQHFDSQVTRLLDDTFPGLGVKLHVPLPDLGDLFKKATVKAIDNGKESEVHYLGHGAQRSIQMSLLRYLAEIRHQDVVAAQKKLLLIDEPELYLHPQAILKIRGALDKLSKTTFQVIFTTHSPLMINIPSLQNSVLVKKAADEGTTVRKSLRQVLALNTHVEKAEALFALGHGSSILFSNGLVVCEGKGDALLLPELFRIVTGRGIEEVGLALLPQGGAGGTRKCMDLLSAMDVPCRALVDLDFAFRNTKQGYIAAGCQELEDAKGIFAQMSMDDASITLANDGFPQNSNTSTAREVFARFAELEETTDIISNLHQQLMGQGVWMWKRGTIEDAVGLQSKKDREARCLIGELRAQGDLTPLGDLASDIKDWADWVNQMAE